MMLYPVFYFNLTYMLILIDVVIPMAASAKLNSTYRRCSAVRGMCGMAGADAVKRLLANQGIYDVIVRRIPGSLTDRYDPKSRTVNLSDAMYSSTSIAAIEVAAHECGHAMQDASDYSPLKMRTALVPATSLRSRLCQPLIIIGLLLGGSSVLPNLDILLFCLAVLFQLVTPPVEYDASHGTVALLDFTGILAGQEAGQTRKVLNVATLTYVTTAATSILQLLRLLILFSNHRND